MMSERVWLGQALAIAITLIALAHGARAQPPTPIEIPWDDLVFEETFTPGTTDREMEPVQLRLNLEPGMQITQQTPTQFEHRFFLVGHRLPWRGALPFPTPPSESLTLLVNDDGRLTLVTDQRSLSELTSRILSRQDDGRWVVEQTHHDVHQRVRHGRRWVNTSDLRPDHTCMQLLDECGRFQDMEGEMPEREGRDALLSMGEMLTPSLFGPADRDIRPGDRWRLTVHSERISGIDAGIDGTLLRIDEAGGQQIAVLQEDIRVALTVPLEIGHQALDGFFPSAGGHVSLMGSHAGLISTALALRARVTRRFNINTGRFMDRRVAFEIHELGSIVFERNGETLGIPINTSISGNERSEYIYEN